MTIFILRHDICQRLLTKQSIIPIYAIRVPLVSHGSQLEDYNLPFENSNDKCYPGKLRKARHADLSEP